MLELFITGTTNALDACTTQLETLIQTLSIAVLLSFNGTMYFLQLSIKAEQHLLSECILLIGMTPPIHWHGQSLAEDSEIY